MVHEQNLTPGGDQPGRAPQAVADQIAAGVLLPVAVARRVLPDRDLPVYLGVAALAVADVVDWPVAVASVLGYAAVRRWRRGGERS